MTQSVDPEFTRRVAEYQKNHQKGMAFVADGTVGGQKAGPSRPAWRSNVMRQTIKLLILAVLIKAILFHGARTLGYDPSAFVLLDSSSIFQKAATLLFYPDPVSQEISRWMTMGQQYLAIEFRRGF